jgi:hypothetical protein
MEVARAGGVRLDLIAEVGDVDAEGMGVLRILRAPDAGEELPARRFHPGWEADRTDCRLDYAVPAPSEPGPARLR